jgi:hypothetical protein
MLAEKIEKFICRMLRLDLILCLNHDWILFYITFSLGGSYMMV